MTDTIDEQARNILERFSVPVRRARPRVAEMLRDADHAMIDTPAGSIATWRLGQGPAILLVHGWEDDNAIWSPLIERLFYAGRSVLVMDLPAHGHSTGERCGLPQSSAAVCAVAQALGPIEAVITHSYGGPTTGLALEQGLQTDAVVMVAPPLALPGQVDKMVERYGISPEVAKRFQEMLPSVLGQPVEWFDLARLAPAMTARALFVHSVDDDSCPYQNSAKLADLWPDGELLLTDGLGHRIVAQDSDIHDRILDFLDGH
jgi:pimeloyl-ACP methyl ester carboxylesterase